MILSQFAPRLGRISPGRSSLPGGTVYRPFLFGHSYLDLDTEYSNYGRRLPEWLSVWVWERLGSVHGAF